MCLIPRTVQAVVGVSFIVIFAAADTRRNPFGIDDVPDPFNESVTSFAKSVELKGDKQDVNAPQWADKPTLANPMFIDGDWSGRWNTTGEEGWTVGTAKVKTKGDCVFILYKDVGASYLIEARRQGENKLVGGYIMVGATSAASPWVGLIVDGERIDGMWTGSNGRWDFRRKAVRKLPKKLRPR